MSKKTIQIIGPFATEYSLSRLNRSLAISLGNITDEYDISLWADEWFADRLPTSNDYKKYPELNQLYSPGAQQADIVIYNSFPKNSGDLFGLSKINAKVKLGYLAWEESVYPKRWVEECNKHLHGIMAISDHVKKVLQHSGVKIPIVTVGVGVDQMVSDKVSKSKIKNEKRFQLLHISSGHYRKGIDVLLKAYFAEFTDKDDIALVIKSFPNTDNQIAELLNQYTTQDSPLVEVINNADLTDNEMRAIIHECDAMVFPSRGEGFGMPMAEAMLFKKPLITTGYSGQMDFCNVDNSWLLDYKLKPSKSNLMIPGAKLAEPDVLQLQRYMRMLYTQQNTSKVEQKVINAYESVKGFTSDNVAKKVLNFVQEIEPIHSLKNKSIAVITPLNSAGGIAEYSNDFYNKLESAFGTFKYLANVDAGEMVSKDLDNILRTWETGEIGFKQTLEVIDQYKFDVIHIQYHSSLYKLLELSRLITQLKRRNVSVLVTFHDIQSNHGEYVKYKEELLLVDTIFIHSEQDRQVFKKAGLENAMLFPHGINVYSDEDKNRLREQMNMKSHPVIASHGMIHDKKGLLELLKAVKLLKVDHPEVLLLAVNALNANNVTSTATHKNMVAYIKENGLSGNVILITEYLSNLEIIKLLQLSDLVVLPYPELQEGASGAVRKAMSASRPVIITTSHIFADLDAGYKVQDNSPANITNGIKALLDNDKLCSKEQDKVKKYVKANSWEKISLRYLTNL